MKKLYFALACVLLLFCDLFGGTDDPVNEKSGNTCYLMVRITNFQSNGITFSSSSEVFIRNVAHLSLDQTRGNQVDVSYLKRIHPRLKVGGGIFGGMDSYRLGIGIWDEFTEYYDAYLTNHDLIVRDETFFGAQVSVIWEIPFGKRSFLDFSARLNGTYFLQKENHISLTDKSNPGQSPYNFFSATVETNRENKVLFGTEIGMAYGFKINPKIALKLGVNLMLSKGNSLESTQDYQLVGDFQTLSGSFTKPYTYAGLSVGAMFSL